MLPEALFVAEQWEWKLLIEKVKKKKNIKENPSFYQRKYWIQKKKQLWTLQSNREDPLVEESSYMALLLVWVLEGDFQIQSGFADISSTKNNGAMTHLGSEISERNVSNTERY